MRNIDVEMCKKFRNDRLRNDRALVHWKSDNNNPQNSSSSNNNNNVVRACGPFPGPKKSAAVSRARCRTPTANDFWEFFVEICSILHYYCHCNRDRFSGAETNECRLSRPNIGASRTSEHRTFSAKVCPIKVIYKEKFEIWRVFLKTGHILQTLISRKFHRPYSDYLTYVK